MANINAAFGFKPIRRLDGAAWSGNLTQLKVANADTNALNRGDVVLQVTTGYVSRAAAGNTAHTIRGVFQGCHYLSAALGYPIWSNYWPGSGATGDIDAFICDDPNVVFEVQASAGPIAFADIGLNADFVVNASTTGFSKWTLNSATMAVTATFPFRVIALGNNSVAIDNGYDTTTAFNVVEVAWNDMFLRQMAGI